MATQTVIFAAPADQTLAAVRLVKTTDDSVFKNAGANTQRTNAKGIYSATFTDCEAADYSIHVQIGSVWLCLGIVCNITNTAATFYQQDLIEPSATVDAASIRAALGMAAADMDSQLDAILAASTGGAGSGAYTLTVTVNDGATALQNATVRMTEGANTFTATTNASGVAVFALDAATYAVAITKDGYQFTPTTRVVSATASQTYSMTAVTITPSPADQVTGYLTTYDENGDVEADVDVTLRIKSAPSDAGFALDSADRVATSDVNGLVEFPGMFPGARYSIWRGTEIPQNPKSFILPTDATDPTALDSFVGTP